MFDTTEILNSGSFQSEVLTEIQLSVFDSFAAVENDWRRLEQHGLATLYQRFDWVKAWAATIGQLSGSQIRIVVAKQENEPLFILPLALRKVGPLQLVGWLADSHSNFQMGLFSKHFLECYTSTEFRRLMTFIAELLGGIDLFNLPNQPRRLFDYDNPFSSLRWHRSPNPAFALDLNGGFEACLSRINGSKRRKKHRWQLKQLGEEDRVFLRTASTQEDVETILETAFSQMSTRFGSLGISNVFADKQTQLFFHGLAARSIENDEPTLRLYALEIDGITRATLSGGMSDKHFSACFISLTEDEFSYLSPGELLIHDVLEDCCARGIMSFDFGRGEERYKRSWTNHEIEMIDVTLPFTTAGRSLAALKKTKAEAKRLVRNNERLWGVAKKVRTRFLKAS